MACARAKVGLQFIRFYQMHLVILMRFKKKQFTAKLGLALHFDPHAKIEKQILNLML